MEQGKPFSTADDPRVDFSAICGRVRAAIEPAHAYAVSLHDNRGDVLLWLSESLMGFDEHNAVRDAFEVFANAAGSPIVVSNVGNSRSALLLRAVNGRRIMVGAIMIVVDSTVAKPDARGVFNVITPKLQSALFDFAEMCPQVEPQQAMSARNNTATLLTLVDKTLAAPPIAAPTPPAAITPSVSLRQSGSPATMAVDPLAGLTGRYPQTIVTPEMDRLHAALRRSPIALHVQRLVPLGKDSNLKCYEVLLRFKAESAPNAAPQAMLKVAVENGLGSMIDRRVVTELIRYLVHHPEIWQSNAVMFSVNLTTTALHDEHYIKFVKLCLEKASLPKGIIAFEVDTTTAVRLVNKIAEVAAALHRMGCPLILDDFGLKTECFALLRLPGVAYIKLAPEITTRMRTDKMSQAAVKGVVQMARVLGMHTVAKHTETAAEQQCFTTLGVDFVQSNSMSPPMAIDSLLNAVTPLAPAPA